jgi:hypothetical protein
VIRTFAAFALALALGGATSRAHAAGSFPIFSTWPQAGGPGSPITLTYSYDNLLDGSLLDLVTREPVSAEVLRGAFEAAFADYAAFLPIHFVEVADAGPPPETGEYDPTGLADIRIGQVPHVDDANAYAYFPSPGSGLAGDIVFNAGLRGTGWTQIFFYVVAQHELGHSLGMGHGVDDEALLAAFAEGYEGPRVPLLPEMIQALQGAYGSGVGSVTPLPVPEPGTLALLAAGLAGYAQIAPRRGRR